MSPEAVFLFLTLAFFIVAANIVYPNFIAPMFNKFEDLDDEELKSGLTALASKSGFTLENIYKIDAGKRDTRLNAYFAGIGKTKKVALYDTLIQKLPKAQIYAVIGHELGHFRLGHLKQSIGAMFVLFFIFCVNALLNATTSFPMCTTSSSCLIILTAFIATSSRPVGDKVGALLYNAVRAFSIPWLSPFSIACL